MSYNSGQKINANDIITEFVNSVINVVKVDTVDIHNIPTSPHTGIKAIPAQYLDNLSNIPTPHIGASGAKISAKNGEPYNRGITYNAIYNGLVYVTRYLLKLGYYRYYEYKTTGPGTGRENVWESSGKAFFKDGIVCNTLGITNISNANLNPSDTGDGGVSRNNIMSISTINQLISNCLASWRDGNKIYCNVVHEYCHSNCHSNCHDDCHSDCYDHTNTTGAGTGIPVPDDGSGCYCNGPWIYGELADQGYTCHSDGECHTDTGGTYTGCHEDSVTFSIRV